MLFAWTRRQRNELGSLKRLGYAATRDNTGQAFNSAENIELQAALLAWSCERRDVPPSTKEPLGAWWTCQIQLALPLWKRCFLTL
jgi:hypothetical protein